MPSNSAHAALVAGAAVAVMAGCATPSQTTSENREQPLYRTGSNLPVKDAAQRSGVIVARPDDVTPGARMPLPPPGAR